MYNEENVTSLKANLGSLAKVIDEFGAEMAGTGRALNVVEQYYNTHLKRVRTNLEGIDQLFDSYIVNPILILPIAHVMRSMLTDFLTAYYLYTYYDHNDEDHTSFENELKLLDRDAYRSVLEWMKVEEDLHRYNEHLPAISEEDIEARETFYREYFSDILNEDSSIKNTTSIRETSAAKFFIEGEQLNQPHRIVSERYKIDRLKRMDYFQMLDGYMLYKYFSQFYHESKLFTILISDATANDNFNLLKWGFIPVYHMTDNAFRIFLNGNNKFSNRLSELKTELEAIENN